MDTSDFLMIQEKLSSFPNANPKLSGLLKFWIERYDGFIEFLTLGDMPTATFLTQKTLELLDNLPQTASTEEITASLSQEFEGLYFQAHLGLIYWNSIDEPFLDYKIRLDVTNTDLDMYISDTPHASIKEIQHWITSYIGES